MAEADGRVHGTTHERPLERFERVERAALRPLPDVQPHQVRVVQRRVANDAFVDVDTVRYSVPYRQVRERAEVWVTATEVRVFRGDVQVAQHARCVEPHARIVDPAHHAGCGGAPRIAAPAPVTSSSSSVGASPTTPPSSRAVCRG